ncbi:MAG: CheR family methyltransferase [Myxococcales bacterium]
MPSRPSARPLPDALVEALLGRLGYRPRPFVADGLRRELQSQARQHELTEDEVCRALLAEPPSSPGLLAVGEAISVGESTFFRHPRHFELLADEIVPALCKIKGGRGLSVLSAGCASGEELYSLAIACERAAPGREHRYHGLDISRAALAAARRGLYRDWSFRGIEPASLSPWVVREGECQWRVDGRVLERARLFHGTLTAIPAELASGGPFDVVFCRNVLIYLTPEAGGAAIRCLAALMSPDGVLFVGPADHDRCSDFAWEQRGSTYFYRPRLRIGPSGRSERTSAPLAGVSRAPPLVEAMAPPLHEPKSAAASLSVSSAAPARYEELMNRGRAALDASDLEGAFAAFDQSIQLLPERPDAYFEQAVLLSERQQTAAARKLLEHALYLDACFTPASVLLARLHLKLGDVERASRLLARLVSMLDALEPHHPVPSWDGVTVAELQRTCKVLLERTELLA